MATTYNFTDVVNNGNPGFNQLLGINNNGTIVGYFGSGLAGQPNQGYTTTLSSITGGTPSFTPENFPGSVQTQVTGINGRDKRSVSILPLTLGRVLTQTLDFTIKPPDRTLPSSIQTRRRRQPSINFSA